MCLWQAEVNHPNQNKRSKIFGSFGVGSLNFLEKPGTGTVPGTGCTVHVK